MANPFDQFDDGNPFDQFDAEAADDLLKGLGADGSRVAPVEPEPRQGNWLSRAFGGLAESNITPSGKGLADRVARFVGRTGQYIAEDPLKALVLEPGAAPYRAGENLMRGDPLGAVTEAGNTALFFIPGAGPAAGGFRGATTRAAIPKPARAAAQRLTEADPNLAEAARSASRLQAGGQPATTADLLNRTAQSRIKGAARRDGPAQDVAQEAFDPRSAAQAERLSNDIGRAFGVSEDFLTAFDAKSAARDATAKPLYQRAYAAPTEATERLGELLTRPPLRRAVAQAQEIAAIMGERLPRGQNFPDTKTLHFMRKALDDQIARYRDTTTGRLVLDERGRALVSLRREFNEALKEANPAFRQADAVWAGETSALQAMEAGVKAAGFTTERRLRQQLANVSDADREFFELGFAQGLTEKIGRGGSEFQNRTLKLLSPESQAAIKTVLGETRGEALLNRLRVENLMARTRNKISPNVGSDTAENVQQSAAQAVSLLGDLASGNLTGLAARGASAFGRKAFARKMMDEQRAVDEQIIRLATENPDELLRILDEISRPRRAPDLGVKPKAAAIGLSAATDQPTDQEPRRIARPPQ